MTPITASSAAGPALVADQLPDQVVLLLLEAQVERRAHHLVEDVVLVVELGLDVEEDRLVRLDHAGLVRARLAIRSQSSPARMRASMALLSGLPVQAGVGGDVVRPDQVGVLVDQRVPVVVACGSCRSRA